MNDRGRSGLSWILLFLLLILMATGCKGFFTSNASSITVTPINPSVTLATGRVQFTALASDGVNTTDVTTSVTWTSSNPAVATISNTAGSQGLATLVATGNTTITATATTSGTTPGATTLTVQ